MMRKSGDLLKRFCKGCGIWPGGNKTQKYGCGNLLWLPQFLLAQTGILLFL